MFQFFLPLRIILFYGEYIVHIHCQCEREVTHTKIVSKCFTKVYVYRIAYFPFHSVFLSVSFSVPFSVPRFSNTLLNIPGTPPRLHLRPYLSCIYPETPSRLHPRPHPSCIYPDSFNFGLYIFFTIAIWFNIEHHFVCAGH